MGPVHTTAYTDARGPAHSRYRDTTRLAPSVFRPAHLYLPNDGYASGSDSINDGYASGSDSINDEYTSNPDSINDEYASDPDSVND